MSCATDIALVAPLTVAKSKRSIFVIDDCLEIVFLMKTFLEMEDFEVRTADSGAEAIRILFTGYTPDLVLLDVQLGDMTGPQVMDVLSERLPDRISRIPFIFLSGADSVTLGKAVRFIQKPPDLNKLIQTINFVIGQRSTYPV